MPNQYRRQPDGSYRKRPGAGGLAAVRRQRLSQHGDTVHRTPLSGLPPQPGHPGGGHPPVHRRLGLSSHDGAGQRPVGAGQPGDYPWHRLRKLLPFPLPLDGHLAHLRAGTGRHRGLVGPGHPGLGSGRGECAERRQLRPGIAPGDGPARRAGYFGIRPGFLRRAYRCAGDQRRGGTGADAGTLFPGLFPGYRQRPGDGLLGPDRPGCPQGRGHHQNGPGKVFLERGIRRQSHCQKPAERGAGSPG